jgi:cobalt-zinc-cadmium efflux system membrane fusion protein
MKKIYLLLAFVSTLLLSCSQTHSHENDSEDSGPEPLAFTIYTDKTELFVEFKPLIIGTESRFAAHFTELGENFKAFTEGNITLTVDVDGKQVAVTAVKPEVPGIFRLRLTPNTSGMAKLTFDIKTPAFTDQIVIDSIKVYADEKSALADQPEEGGNDEISYLKEQAWKVEFANEPVKRRPFYDIIKTSGQILSTPEDEMTITARAGGIVKFSGKNMILGSAINAGAALFAITGGDLSQDNLDARYLEVKTEYDKAKTDYDRASELVKDKIISEKDFQEIKLRFDQAQLTLNTLGKNYSSSGKQITAPMTGYLKNILVAQGQYVEAGTPLAVISKNNKILLQANVSQKYFQKLASIRSANFRTSDNLKTYNTDELHGHLVAYGKSASANSPFIPVTFEMDNTGNLIPGSVADVYLRTSVIPNIMTIPVTSLVEEQGVFYVYIQTGGESFQKREIQTGSSDGIHIQVLSGLSVGERVVTKGAYQIKLSAATGTLPAHGHEH